MLGRGSGHTCFKKSRICLSLSVGVRDLRPTQLYPGNGRNLSLKPQLLPAEMNAGVFLQSCSALSANVIQGR